VLCEDIVSFDGRGDLQASWTVQWPATGSSGPSSFDGVVDGGTLQFQSAHGSFTPWWCRMAISKSSAKSTSDGPLLPNLHEL
jgi:hypothetical protein